MQDTIVDNTVTKTIPLDSLASDSINVPVAGEIQQGIVLINPLSEYQTVSDNSFEDNSGSSGGMSWIYLVLALLFCAIGIKFKGSVRYVEALIADLTDTRVRHNVFDDTVKETTLIILLNIVWALCAGIMLWISVSNGLSVTDGPEGTNLTEAQGIGICSAIAACYLIIMLAAYWIVGNVFSDSKETELWVKGAASSVGLQAVVLFPISLIALNYTSWSGTLLILSIILFVIGKIIFLFQGFRIFFTQISSWLLFLYYLCSLEIIPVILTYVITVKICSPTP